MLMETTQKERNMNQQVSTQSDAMTALRHFVEMRDDMQRMRIQLSNRLAAVERGDSVVGDFYKLAIDRYATRFADVEDNLGVEIRKLADSLSAEVPLLADMQCVKGIGPVLAARLLVELDFTRAHSASSLWAYCGYAPGKDRLVKGQKRAYNARARTVCYLIGASFLKSRSPYRAIYDSAAAHYAAVHPEWTPRHRALASMRKMVKRFLAHLYVVGRTRHGLPVRRPYVQDYLAHVHIDHPEDYGWPVVYPVYEDAPDVPAYVEPDVDELIYEMIGEFEMAELSR